MTAWDKVSDIAMLLPEVEQRDSEGQTTFTVDGEGFLEFVHDPAAVRVREPDATGRAGSGWLTLDLGDDADWALIEDRIARSWEVTAPPHLLEAGGR